MSDVRTSVSSALIPTWISYGLSLLFATAAAGRLAPQGEPVPEAQLTSRNLPVSTKEAIETARGKVRDQAERSRTEIADLVAEDRDHVAALVSEAVKKEIATTVKATKSGRYRFVFAGISTTAPATSTSDAVVVK